MDLTLTMTGSVHFLFQAKLVSGRSVAKSERTKTQVLWAAGNGRLPKVQYLCEQGADKEARAEDGG